MDELIATEYKATDEAIPPKLLLKKLGVNVVASVFGVHHNRSDGEWHEAFVILADGNYLILDLNTSMYNTEKQVLIDIMKAPLTKAT